MSAIARWAGIGRTIKAKGIGAQNQSLKEEVVALHVS